MLLNLLPLCRLGLHAWRRTAPAQALPHNSIPQTCRVCGKQRETVDYLRHADGGGAMF